MAVGVESLVELAPINIYCAVLEDVGLAFWVSDKIPLIYNYLLDEVWTITKCCHTLVGIVGVKVVSPL